MQDNKNDPQDKQADESKQKTKAVDAYQEEANKVTNNKGELREEVGSGYNVQSNGGGWGSNIVVWLTVLMMYLLLLGGIGYVSFWDQDFNRPENTIGAYLELLENKPEPGEDREYSPAVKEMIDKDFSVIIQEVMKNNADAAGDLQELASQSFNIILGAILAFLSATATMIFQKLSEAGHREDDKNDK